MTDQVDSIEVGCLHNAVFPQKLAKNMNRQLKIGVVSRISSQTIGTELASEARKRGHVYDQIVFDTVELTEAATAFETASLLQYDILYYRTSLGPVWARALERYLKQHSRRAINLTAVQFPFLSNKALQALTLGATGIRTPKTILDATHTYKTIVEELGSPFVVKATDSCQGKDVHLIHSTEAFTRYIEQRTHKDFLYQQYLAHDYDCRIHLIGGAPVAGYRRMKMSEDFRCNVHLGAKMEPLSTQDEKTLFPMAEQVASLFSLELHVVDFLRCTEDGEYYFVEINDNAGWEISDKDATGVDMSALVIDYCEKLARISVS